MKCRKIVRIEATIQFSIHGGMGNPVRILLLLEAKANIAVKALQQNLKFSHIECNYFYFFQLFLFLLLTWFCISLNCVWEQTYHKRNTVKLPSFYYSLPTFPLCVSFMLSSTADARGIFAIFTTWAYLSNMTKYKHITYITTFSLMK